MFSGTAKPKMTSAAWRISLWAALAFALGTMIVFIFLHRFVAGDIERRTDAWLTGEVAVLRDVAEKTPRQWLSMRLVGEIAELASREVPFKQRSNKTLNDSVFFIQTAADNSLLMWVGVGEANAHLSAVLKRRFVPETPTDVAIGGFDAPFRVVCISTANKGSIYLGVSERDQLRVLNRLRVRFILLWLLIVFIGYAVVFLATRKLLRHVRRITEAASGIGEADLSRRVPTTRRNDEVGQLALTLNRMLDRIESSVHQLHTITGSLAHDLRSPLTAVRARLEMALTADARDEEGESIISAIEDLDRLTEFLNKSLDVAEEKANALRLNRVPIDLDELLRAMIDLYEPGMSEKGIHVRLCSAGKVEIDADAALIHRMMANLFDNELNHLPPSCSVTISLRASDHAAFMMIEDNGPGFDPEIVAHLFEHRVRGRDSKGHGLGLAFVQAVVRAHGGTVEAANRGEGGAWLAIQMPRAIDSRQASTPEMALASR
ncbi:MAG TPA: ATP-binding protein [Bryobacteraceae bacterium]|nr:ATP-binding protein [Bryobacteraceae bacterium]